LAQNGIPPTRQHIALQSLIESKAGGVVTREDVEEFTQQLKKRQRGE